MDLQLIWFLLITVLWTGYFVLEGFDFGVGMLLPILGGRSRGPEGAAEVERRRRVLINTIGPVWDGNEVWVLTAGGATFAAFPHWYATLFSGFYLPLLLILVALIVRNMGFEYRHKRDDDTWRRRWDLAIVIGSVVPAFLWGVAFANIVWGVPINADMEYTGTLFTLLGPVGLLGGLTTTALFLTHGAIYVSLKTVGEIRFQARAFAWKAGLVAALLAVVFLGVMMVHTGSPLSWALSFLAAVFLVIGLVMIRAGHEGKAFLGSLLAIALAVWALFAALFPDVMPSSTNPAWSLTYQNASASDLTLKIMTGAALIFTPIVLLYTGYTYWVFRKRIGTQHIPAPHEPTDQLLAQDERGQRIG
ncbi:cytochrome d ubiquinol oxidase subunit II [Arsenicicoccus piscis]|uniref:Cytochrome c oxidase assembly protein n=1 Tax=Arsenicicoccus piscis TaxID=673954 RepID=A0ABQ6HSJ4_9MICO|nr:cytochrome d ubiquinol oxidase subunit II [Arsenicicoccus piscis]MCH8626554.1 cytochrome d ubiquinol oxidase subunit II [Arsenicicoccus piscis]GMA21200.1 cytochrome c oxidase assembly protein [Arsenicicoccus piscis]